MDIKNANQAIHNGITSLYHYQTFNSNNDKKWLSETLLENKIYCSNPSDFNDPWDMKPLVREIDSVNTLNEFCEYLRSKMIEYGFSKEKINFFLNDPHAINNMLESSSLDYWSVFEKNFRVYCLSPKPDNLLMWSHYANKHRGICLEFDTNNSIFGSAWEVEYHEEYPYYPWKKNFDNIRLALIKAKCWEYEEEYRVIPKTKHANTTQPQTLNVDSNNKLIFPANALKSVIVGCMANYDEINDFIHSIRPELPVRRTILKRHRYGLYID